jgi:predicted lipoprotein
MSGAPADSAAADRDEVAEKSVWWRSDVVDARLRAIFSASDAYAASVGLAALAPDPGCEELADETACRLMLAAIKVSEGDVAKLLMWVEAGRNDPRDLIAAAEYRRELVDGDLARRDDDLDDYLRWVAGEG